MNPFQIARRFMASPKVRAGLIAMMFGSGFMWGMAVAFIISIGMFLIQGVLS